MWSKRFQLGMLCLCLYGISNLLWANNTRFDLGNSLDGVPKDSASLKGDYFTPMLSTVQMSTHDGQTQFDASLQCPASSEYLKILAQSGASGDINYLRISQDLDTDGQVDQIYTLTQPISGVCANGMVSCDAGTWDNCRYFRWVATSENILGFQETGQNQMGGCYCINNSCGTNIAVNSLPFILQGLAGGAAGALMQVNPVFAISNTKVAPPMIEVYGQDMTGCGNGNPADMTQYANNPSIIESDAVTLSADPSGLYQLIANSSSASNTSTSDYDCSIKRIHGVEYFPLEDIISKNGGTGGVHRCAEPNCLELVLGRVGDNYWGGSCLVKHQAVQFYVLEPDRIQSAVLVRARWDDWIRVAANGQKIWAYPYSDWDGITTSGKRCEWSTSWNVAPNVDFTSLIKQEGLVDFQIDVQVTGGGEGYAYAQIFVDEECQAATPYMTNTCQALADDPECEVLHETVDGVQTHLNQTNTGLLPLPSSRTITEGMCSKTFTNDWWEIERTYRCKTNFNHNFDNAMARVATVQGSTTDNSYDDVVFVDGVPQAVNNNSIEANDFGVENNSCALACRVRKLRDAITVSDSGPSNNLQNGMPEEEIVYRACTGINQDDCPVSAGETIINSCQCLQNFGEASVAMQALRKAGQDLICTSGTPGSL